MSEPTPDWPGIRPLRPLETRQSPHYSGMVEIDLRLSRATTAEWDLLFEQALRDDPEGREVDGIKAGLVPSIWGSVTKDRAGSLDSIVSEAIAVTNLRFRTQFLPTLDRASRDQIIHDAIAGDIPPEPPVS